MLKLKTGDRFFFSTVGSGNSFTKGQVDELKKSSLARVVCDNTGVRTMQPNAFRIVSNMTNPLLDCSSKVIESIDLRSVNTVRIKYKSVSP